MNDFIIPASEHSVSKHIPSFIPVGQTEKYLQKLAERVEEEEDGLHEQNKHV